MGIDKLIVDNMGLVYQQLHKFNRAYDDEAFSFAMEALMNAAKTYNPKKGYAFSTYATVCIYNGISMYLRSLNNKRKIDTVSYDDTLIEGENLTYLDILQDDNTPACEVLKEELYAVLWKAFDKLQAELQTSSAKTIVKYWRDSGFTLSQSEIAKKVGISQAQVSRILAAFKCKLRNEMEGYINDRNC